MDKQLMSGQWQLRTMQSQDIPQIMMIERTAQLVPWTEDVMCDCLQAAYYHCRVVEQKNNIIGFSIVILQLGECHILNLCVWPAAQRQGVGNFLMQHILQQARLAHAELAWLEVRATNQPAIQLYRQAGFIQTGIRKGYYYLGDGRYEDALIFSLALTN